MTTIEWRTPAPAWTKATLAGVAALRPRIVACSGDTFLQDFLALMQGQTPGKTSRGLAELLLPPEQTQTLFQPAHGRYYLLAGSLVCRQLGLPDRSVSRATGETVSFVIRRLARDADGTIKLLDGSPAEEAWVDDGPARGWHACDVRDKLAAAEERLPMHHVDACAAYAPNEDAVADMFGLSECGRRTVYYGYIPVGNREKYTERRPHSLSADGAAEIQAFVDAVVASGETGHDPRLDEVDTRVIASWRSLTHDPVTDAPLPGGQKPSGPQLATASFFLLLDVADVLHTHLPSVYAALGTDGSALLAAGSARRRLFDRLRQIKGVDTANGQRVLTDVLKDVEDMLPLVQDGADATSITDEQIRTRSAPYDLTKATPADDAFLAPPRPQKPLPPVVAPVDTLYEFFFEALAEEKNERIGAGRPWMPAPSAERLGLLHDQVVPRDDRDDVYVLRMVYQHAPCCPVVSAPTGRVRLAKFYDPDAPARHIRIELPSVKPRDLRKYKRGVGLEMSPELRDLMNRVNKGMLKDDGLAGDSTSWQLGMICSFSLQIIFLVAFIVMFIFLILLNIVFWWLPFLKICFPIPVKGK